MKIKTLILIKLQNGKYTLDSIDIFANCQSPNIADFSQWKNFWRVRSLKQINKITNSDSFDYSKVKNEFLEMIGCAK